MGIVFRARDRELDRDVAIKVTAWSTMADADRLRAEARALARLEHPGIVPVHDVGQLPDGRVFTVMMLVRGERLDARALQLALPDRLRLFDRICDTVSFAHARGLVHRDLKPANIMVGEHGQVLVLDWGLARAACDGSASGGAGGGTEGYMAPEQSTPAFDIRSDVFALGAILRDLAGADGTAIPRPLASIVTRATDPDPAKRYASPAAPRRGRAAIRGWRRGRRAPGVGAGVDRPAGADLSHSDRVAARLPRDARPAAFLG